METYIDRKDGSITYLGVKRKVKLYAPYPVGEQYADRMEKKLRECAEVEGAREFREHLRLSTLLDRDDMLLDSDFAPLSFTFHGIGDLAGLFGGLIFHGVHDRGGDGGAPTFSMNLSPVDGWAMHT